MWYNKGTKKERYKAMEKYVIYGANKSWKVEGLERALEYAERESKTCFRVSVFDSNNKKVAKFEFGKRVA
jgi:hypothetical protein